MKDNTCDLHGMLVYNRSQTLSRDFSKNVASCILSIVFVFV